MDMARSTIPALPCMCASLRRASRAITQLYEQAVSPAGLSATQFTILQTLSLAGEITQGELARILAMDSTTLTRTLAIMTRSGWITKRRGKDRREWRMRPSTAGKTLFKRALPHWQKAQTKLRRQLGNELSDALIRLTQSIANALTD
jgi:DNA-binding MarR family transcriptional regulator